MSTFVGPSKSDSRIITKAHDSIVDLLTAAQAAVQQVSQAKPGRENVQYTIGQMDKAAGHSRNILLQYRLFVADCKNGKDSESVKSVLEVLQERQRILHSDTVSLTICLGMRGTEAGGPLGDQLIGVAQALEGAEKFLSSAVDVQRSRWMASVDASVFPLTRKFRGVVDSYDYDDRTWIIHREPDVKPKNNGIEETQRARGQDALRGQTELWVPEGQFAKLEVDKLETGALIDFDVEQGWFSRSPRGRRSYHSGYYAVNPNLVRDGRTRYPAHPRATIR